MEVITELLWLLWDIHITDLSWGRVDDPHKVVELDQKINVVILDFDDEKRRIALGLK
ncbi:MAG: S1 RNA-binding domain-containing protein, partial [Lachnospiraceae bacterium]|nr:S1 RNA-binding domain-containing protein [Lachnospiraceae bacterium]